MSVSSINSTDTTVYPFGTIAKASLAGGVLGYVAKNMLPLNESEMDTEFKGAIAIIKEQSNKAKAGAIETIRNIKNKTLAQDVFIKMVDAESISNASKDAKVNRAFDMKKIITDAKLGHNDMIELKGIIASVNKKGSDMCKRCIRGFETVVKDKRVTPLYVASGAVLGFFVGLGQSIFKSSVNA